MVRSWFLGEVLARLPEGSVVLELGCGPGTDAAALSAGRRYVGVDLSMVQLSIARQRVPDALFVVGDFTSMAFRPASFDGVVGCFAFNHVPLDEVQPTFARIFEWLRPGGQLMSSLLMTEAEDRGRGMARRSDVLRRCRTAVLRTIPSRGGLRTGALGGPRRDRPPLRPSPASLGHREEATQVAFAAFRSAARHERRVVRAREPRDRWRPVATSRPRHLPGEASRAPAGPGGPAHG